MGKISLPNIKTSVGIANKEVLDAWIDGAKQHVEETAQQVALQHADKVAATARELVPVQSGLLKDSIRVGKSKKGAGALVLAGAGNGYRAYHAHLVMFGTVHSAPNPFLYKAADRHRAEFSKELQDAMDKDTE